MAESLRVGLIGYGSAGRGSHSRLLREAGQRVTCVVTRQHAEAVRADWPTAAVVPEVAGLLERVSELDLVVVASPTRHHVQHVAEALRAGVHVVVDKPLATTAHDARELARTAEGRGGRLTVFHDRRWDSEQLTLQQVLARGELGRVHRFERRWERWRPVPLRRWKETDTTGGGLLLDLGVHLVDSAVQLFGPVTSVYAEIRALTTPADDDVFLALQHASSDDGPGVLSHLQAGGLVGAPGPRTRVLGERAAYLVTSFEGEPTPFAVMDEPHRQSRHEAPEHEGWLVRGSERTPVERAPGGRADLYRAVVRWVVDGGPPPVDPWDAVHTAEVLDAARVSSHEHRVVSLP